MKRKHMKGKQVKCKQKTNPRCDFLSIKELKNAREFHRYQSENMFIRNFRFTRKYMFTRKYHR